MPLPNLQDDGFLAAVTDAVARSYRDFYRRDPASACSGYVGSELVVTVAADDASAADVLETLRRGELRPDPRSEFQDVMEPVMVRDVETLSQRSVVLTSSQTRPSPHLEIEWFAFAADPDGRAPRRGPAMDDSARLLRAARELGAESSPGDVTAARVAARAGVSVEALYARFPTLADCLDAARRNG